ncbi:amylo-alpha-1,6-glucosidase [Mycobacterium sp. SMC-2]|uniref:amylo-alpha-1,6-glucosidase n=1 Tax=Mycobacterium sp. SMC-2 TaxID=2857058 RepID=UPI0021B39A0E|nr:glycogen debranching N-terminal domain-containing protein [Mycobacterium sp. SMC-2]UXA05987.1 amylo-alpha-1,6-glucosidase [Mycobacterium sp. SMC-2]
MTVPTAFNCGAPVAIGAGSETVTLVEGGTFCLSDRHGDVLVGTSHGLFFRDARVLSRWELRVDGQVAEPLTVESTDAFAAQFISRRPPHSGADSTLLVVRERLVADGLRETIWLHNMDKESTVVALELQADADFADLFAVKEGRAPVGGAEKTVAGGELVLRSRADQVRGLTVSATGDPIVLPGSLNWRVVVPPGGRWQTEIMVHPTWANHKVQTRLPRGENVRSSAPARKIEAWRDTATTIETDHAVLAQVLSQTERDLGALLIHDADGRGRPYVAAGAPWFMTLFGRDSLLTAWMALPLDVGLSIGTLQRLAAMQGRRVDPLTEEEPGRIMHEIRRGPASADVLGGSVYYGTADATLLFVMLLAECWRWGAEEAVIRPLLPAADAALAWVEQYGDRDGDCFVEYRRATDRGLINQGWKDSFNGINDAAGRPGEPPIALCEVQGYVYAALLSRAELADALGDQGHAARLRERAALLRAKFAEAFWLPEKGWYAVALDGSKRPLDALTSNVGHCLWTGIATEEYAAAVVERLSAPEMDSGFGLRTLATTMGAYNPMSYHNGSVWPHDTAIAVAGLLRYRHVPGAASLAERLANGLLDAATAFGGRLPELFCGFPRSQFASPVPYPTSCSPQAWASAAPLLLLRSFLGLDPHVPNRTLSVSPQLPAAWGKIVLANLRLGRTTVHLEAEGETVQTHGLSEDWQLVTPST